MGVEVFINNIGRNLELVNAIQNLQLSMGVIKFRTLPSILEGATREELKVERRERWNCCVNDFAKEVEIIVKKYE